MSPPLDEQLERLEKRPLLFLPLLWLAAWVICLLCSFNTSLLNPFYGGDAHFFSLMGRMTAQGALPFADIYDQKGPWVFYINALGYIIHPGKAGMLLLQSLALTISLLLVYRLCRLWGSGRQSLTATGLFVFVYAACLWGGNMTEEYSLPLCLAPTYLILKELRRETRLAGLPLSTALLAGACLGVLAFLRANNAAPLCGVLAGLLFSIKTRKDVWYLLRYAACAVLGLLLTTAPLMLYFAAHGAWHDLMMGTFIHNKLYALGHTGARSWTDDVEVGVKASSLLLLAWVLWKKRARWAGQGAVIGALSTMAVFSTVTPTLGPNSSHYFIMAAPAIALTLLLYLHLGGRHRYVAPALLMLPFILDAAHLAAGFRRYNLIRNYQDDIDAAQHIAALIPASDRNSVWACDVHASIYTYGGLTPCCRYFTMQSEMAKFNPDITPAIARLMQETPPRWLLVPYGSGTGQTAVHQALESGAYTLIYSDSSILGIDLWKRTGTRESKD